jgi:porphobilinogen deaminase
VHFDGLAASEDGAEHYRVARDGEAREAEALARDAAADIRARAGAEFIACYLSG